MRRRRAFSTLYTAAAAQPRMSPVDVDLQFFFFFRVAIVDFALSLPPRRCVFDLPLPPASTRAARRRFAVHAAASPFHCRHD